MNLTNDSSNNDRDLVEAVRHNNAAAFKVLYCKYFNPLIRFAWYRIHSVEASRDLVQEIFFRVWLKRENLNPDKSFKAYLYKSLNNLIINYRKLKSTGTVSLEDECLRKRKYEEEKIDVEIDTLNALDKLPEKMKTVFILSRTEGYKYSEIAEICGISVKAVEKRMTKAFTLLKKYLA